MKKHVLFITFLLLSSLLFAQTNNRALSIKLYENVDIQSLGYSESIPNFGKLKSESDYISVGHLSLGLQWEKEKFTHEVEISTIRFDRSAHIKYEDYGRSSSIVVLDGEVMNDFRLKLRYELAFTNHSDKKIKPVIGFAFQPYLYYEHTKPETPTFFPKYKTTIGATAFLVPRVIYNLNERIYLDFNLPFGIFDFYWFRTVQRNPSLTIDDQIKEKAIFELVYKTFQLRLGLGIRI